MAEASEILLIMEGENWLPRVVLCPSHMHRYISTRSLMHTNGDNKCF